MTFRYILPFYVKCVIIITPLISLEIEIPEFSRINLDAAILETMMIGVRLQVKYRKF